jgi:hypothetical protein
VEPDIGIRSIDFFFGSEGFNIGDTFVLWHRFITILTAVASRSSSGCCCTGRASG